jgi:hypothetical protein
MRFRQGAGLADVDPAYEARVGNTWPRGVASRHDAAAMGKDPQRCGSAGSCGRRDRDGQGVASARAGAGAWLAQPIAVPSKLASLRASAFLPAAVLASALTGVAHADVGALNTDAFDLSGALDRDVAPTRRSLEVAVGAGYTQGVGGAGSVGSLEDLTGPGGSVELQLGLRASPGWSLGLYSTLARFRRGDESADGTRAYGATAGVQAVWHSRESRSLDPWVSVGAGWRGLWLSPRGGDTISVHGVEVFRLQLGIDYRFTPWLSVAPVIGASASLFLAEDASMDSSLTAIHDNRLNLYGFTGVLGRFDLGG